MLTLYSHGNNNRFMQRIQKRNEKETSHEQVGELGRSGEIKPFGRRTRPNVKLVDEGADEEEDVKRPCVLSFSLTNAVWTGLGLT